MLTISVADVGGAAYYPLMPSNPLDPDTLLSIELATICSRNQYTDDPGPVIAELIATAGDHHDVLAREAGSWSGFYDDEYTHALAQALLEIPGAADWVQLGRERRNAGTHGTQGYARP